MSSQEQKELQAYLSTLNPVDLEVAKAMLTSGISLEELKYSIEL